MENEDEGWALATRRKYYHKHIDEGGTSEDENEDVRLFGGEEDTELEMFRRLPGSPALPPLRRSNGGLGLRGSRERYKEIPKQKKATNNEMKKALLESFPIDEPLPNAQTPQTPETRGAPDLDFSPHSPQPFSPSPDHRVSENASQVEYIFTGTLTLLPLSTLFFGIGAGVALMQAEKPYLGVSLAAIAILLFIALVTFIVVKITFTFDLEVLVIKKSGIFRSKTLQFDLANTSLHYFRSHFSEDKSWLQLLVKENGQYYTIFSWKGRGNQRDRFLALFVRLQRELIKWKTRASLEVRDEDFANTEILSRAEINLLHPFTGRLQTLATMGLVEDVLRVGYYGLCVEDVPVIDYDNFFRHFRQNKLIPRESQMNRPMVIRKR